MIHTPKTNSFFIFGARGTGKTTLLNFLYSSEETVFIDLLDLEEETRYLRDPELLSRTIDAFPPKIKRVVVDEIQRVPRLLDVIHRKIEEKKRKQSYLQFVITGSSARKLKRGASNLLAGRAFVYYLFPLTASELGKSSNLRAILEYGSLPEVWNFKDSDSKIRYLEAYSRTYLKEEVWNEQMIRKIEPFSNFLEVAAQMNGEVLNYTKIARDIGVDTKSIQAYYQILEDTLLGFRVPAYRRSIRKRQLTNPKFYLFDTGVKRALDRTLTVSLLPQTYAFGNAFEHFLILEMHRLNEYQKLDFRFSYLKTHDGAEIDLMIERPGNPIALVEIKSSQRVTPQMIKHLETFSKEFSQCHACLLSLDEKIQKFGRVQAFPWQRGLEYLGFSGRSD